MPSDALSLVAVRQGSLMLFSHYESDGEMWVGEGPREVRRTVAFPQAFAAIPVVQVGLGLIDAASAANLRTDISAVDVTPDGFTVLFRTWGDTRIARIRADWLAIGAANDPSVWNLV